MQEGVAAIPEMGSLGSHRVLQVVAWPGQASYVGRGSFAELAVVNRSVGEDSYGGDGTI